MDEIAKAFMAYTSLLDHLKWLRDNGDLPADTNVGQLAFQGSIAYSSPTVIAAFVASMELEKARLEELTKQPKRPRALTSQKAIAEYEANQAAERALFDKARALACELGAAA